MTKRARCNNKILWQKNLFCNISNLLCVYSGTFFNLASVLSGKPCKFDKRYFTAASSAKFHFRKKVVNKKMLHCLATIWKLKYSKIFMHFI